MRNSMFVATCGFFVLFWLFEALQNHALWLSMLCFMAARGMALGWILYRQWRAGAFFPESI